MGAARTSSAVPPSCPGGLPITGWFGSYGAERSFGVFEVGAIGASLGRFGLLLSSEGSLCYCLSYCAGLENWTASRVASELGGSSLFRLGGPRLRKESSNPALS